MWSTGNSTNPRIKSMSKIKLDRCDLWHTFYVRVENNVFSIHYYLIMISSLPVHSEYKCNLMSLFCLLNIEQLLNSGRMSGLSEQLRKLLIKYLIKVTGKSTTVYVIVFLKIIYLSTRSILTQSDTHLVDMLRYQKWQL